MPFTVKTVCLKSLRIHRFYVETTITIEELKTKILEKNNAPEGVSFYILYFIYYIFYFLLFMLFFLLKHIVNIYIIINYYFIYFFFLLRR
jgi:hypothetical protein